MRLASEPNRGQNILLDAIYSRRKFRSQTSDNMDKWKSRGGKVREEKGRRKKIIESKVRRKKIQVSEKVGKPRNTVFPMICGSRGSKSRLAKAAGAEPSGQMRDEKLHAVVARSTFPSQKDKKLTGSDHFWKLRCRKSVRRCGAKHISKSYQKIEGYGALLDVQMWFRVAGAGDFAPCQYSEQNERVL